MAIHKELTAAIPSKIYVLNCVSIKSDIIPHQYFRLIFCSLYPVHSQKKSPRLLYPKE